MEQAGAGTDWQAKLRRVVDFPLVAMVFGVLLFLFANALGMSLGQLVPAMAAEPQTAAKAAINLAIMFATYKLAIARLGEQRHDDLRAEGAFKYLGLGLLAGLVIFSAVVGVAAVADVYNIVGEGGTADLIMDLITVAILPGFMEEVLFRGILFRWIEEFAGSWAALLVTSALFGLAHIYNPNATWFSSFAIAVEAGLLLGGAYMLTRSLWMPIGLHASWNFTQGTLFDVPVSGLDGEGLVEAQLSGPTILSGGTFGLEASLIALLIATAAGAWMVWLAIKRGELMQPWWVRRRLARSQAA